MKIIVNILTNQVIGKIEGSDDSMPNTIFVDIPDGFNADSDLSEFVWDGSKLQHDPMIALNKAKTDRITQIRKEQAQQINALAWRVERAKECELIGAAGESVTEILTLRETIRQKGNQACIDVQNLTDLQNVKNFSWSV